MYKLRCRSCLFGVFSFFHSSSCTAGPISSKIYFLCRFIFHSGLDERERVPRSIGNASMFLKTYFTPRTRSPFKYELSFLSVPVAWLLVCGYGMGLARNVQWIYSMGFFSDWKLNLYLVEGVLALFFYTKNWNSSVTVVWNVFFFSFWAFIWVTF